MQERETHVKRQTCLVVGAMATILLGCGGSDTPTQTRAQTPDTLPAQPATGAVTQAGASKIDGADFVLEEQPPLEQKVDLAGLPESEQKAVYFELRRLMDEASQRVMLSGVDVDKLSGEEAVRLMDNVQNKAKYEFAAAKGVTMAQLDQLDVDAMRSGWHKDYLAQ